jgi:2'-5' RNA ligase
MVRAFMAIDLPPAITRKMAESQKELAKSDARLTFVAPGNMHITLKFIGEISPAMVEKVKEELSTFLFQPFDMQLTGVGTNNPRRPRVIWAVGHDNGESSELHSKIEKLLEPFGIKRENRAFTLHATIARVRRYESSLAGQLELLASADFGTFTVHGCSLKKSTLTKKGPIYENLTEVVF